MIERVDHQSSSSGGSGGSGNCSSDERQKNQ